MAIDLKLIYSLAISIMCILPGVLSVLDFEETTTECRKNFTQLAEMFGRQCEVYDVITEDGYIIQLHRLVGNKTKLLYFFHGLIGSSDDFIMRGLNSSAIVLNDAGYDVWLGNARGNRYSRRHTTLDPDKDRKYWKFSFHQMGYYDLPASIDFILKITGQEKLCAIGFSIGNTVFYVLGSMRPGYNDKIQLMIAMGPVAYLNHMRGLAKMLPVSWVVISAALALLGKVEVFRDSSAERQLLKYACSQGMLGYDACIKGFIMPLVGDDSAELEPEFARFVKKHFPAGTSRCVLDHFTQIGIARRFCLFNYGAVQNLDEYGDISPPNYDLSKVRMPVALLVGANDNIATVEDVEQLRRELPNVTYYKVMDRKEFNHIDFTLGRHINEYLNPLLKFLLSQYGN